MFISPLIAVGVIGLAVVLLAGAWREHRPGAQLRARERPLVNDVEREMFRRLVTAFPEGVVLVKVALSALISVPVHEREKLRHRHVDFVLCDHALKVYAVVQLEQDEELQSFRVGESAKVLLSHAGYVVLAWAEPPSVEEIADALAPVRRAGPLEPRTGPYAAKPSAD
jgi:hypothetical protein